MADLAPELSAALAGRYAIERELGRGGMATVYLARDLRHDRPVALKVLHAELAAGIGPERFQREIKLCARLQHPHILTVHDSGEIVARPATLLWFTMPYIEGESLRDRLTRETQLPLDVALGIAREAADALDYAHRHGVIHRDIKPENILVAEGHALVADFGIGKALAQAGSDKLTETGLAVGTPAYMSPEQAAGTAELDARSDIYSLATVLYEMLAGETPFAGPTAQAMIARRFMETPRPLRQLRESVPEQVEQAVQRGLARTAADRFATAAQFAAALGAPGTTSTQSGATASYAPAPAPPSPAPPASGPPPVRARRGRFPVAATSLGLGFLLGLGLLFGWLRRHGEGAPGAAGVKLVAVLPFDNLGSKEDEYFADGITDEIRAKLAGIPGLQVTASRSAAEYKNSSKDLATIAHELGVDYLLVGKVRWEKGAGGSSRVRVSPELIQVASGSTKWEQPFEANLTDVFQVQADVASRVAQALDVALGAGAQQVLAERPTRSLPAYDAYLKGEEISLGMATADPQTVRRALVYYDQAIALDSTFAAAWAERGRAYAALYSNGVPDPGNARLALESAQRARGLAPGRADGYLALAEYYRSAIDPAHAFEEAQEGLKVAPTNVGLLVVAALAQQARGGWDTATVLLARAQAIDPRSAATGWRLARSLLFQRRYDQALAACERGLQIAPTHVGLLESRVMIAAARGDLAAARAAVGSATRAVDPATFVSYAATYYDLFWLFDESQRALLFQLGPDRFDGDRGSWGLALAGAYALQGDTGRSRAYADSARAALEDQIKATPTDGQLHVLLGVALAYTGRKADAIREGRRGVELTPTSVDAFGGPYVQHQLVRIYLLVGEPEQALDQLEPLLELPYFLSPGWLRIDPTFDPIRTHAGFERLMKGTAGAKP
ncbi:MAG TPA: protein kinase [Gemmatimonadales bacterium]|jgi:serine/threonine-protein kinase|nr:protein kinase [Gemmatimonadales bacterium]